MPASGARTWGLARTTADRWRDILGSRSTRQVARQDVVGAREAGLQVRGSADARLVRHQEVAARQPRRVAVASGKTDEGANSMTAIVARTRQAHARTWGPLGLMLSTAPPVRYCSGVGAVSVPPRSAGSSDSSRKRPTRPTM